MKAKNMRAKALSRRLVGPATVSAFGAALCASFSAGSAHATPVAFDISDVTLGTVPFVLNLDGDAFPDYTFQRSSPVPSFQNDVNTLGNSVVGFVVAPALGDGSASLAVIGETKPGTYASALAEGNLINAAQQLVSGPDVILSGKLLDFYGQYLNPGLAFIGLQFDIPGSTPHFGWVSAVTSGSNVTLTCYGYETAANTGITAGAGIDVGICGTAVPEPGSLALLIAGAAGVLAMRRRQRSRP